MSGKHTPTSKSRAHSWFSRHFKKLAPSPLSSSSPASSVQLCSRSPGNSTEGLDVPADRTDRDVSPVPVPHQPPASSVSVYSTANSLPAHSSPSLYPSSSSLSRMHPPTTSDGAGNLETTGLPVDTTDFPLASPSHHLLVPNAPIPSATTTVPAHSPQGLSPSPQTLLPCQHSTSHSNSSKMNMSPHYADIEPPPAFTYHPSSLSTASTTSTSNPANAPSNLSPQSPTYHAENSASRNYPHMYLAPPTPPPLSQGQALKYQGPGQLFNQAHDFVMKDTTFIENINMGGDNFMKELLQRTIIGAEFDSSDRDPPPRCHPGTRLAIIQRCLDFITQCLDEGKVRWVVGPAGVGKSAVMQMVTEMVPDDIVFVSIFLSVNGRRDGSKTILTIAYQLAVKCGPYRQFIRDQVMLDPSLLRKSITVQFKKFIVEPFVSGRLFEPSRRFLVAIDGLDECDNHLTQRKLLELITDFCISHPTSPIAWVIASRPEPHITLFFDKAEVKRAFTKEEIQIDSDEACEEVQRYLRDELKKIKDEHPTLRHKREWPLEHEFTKIASAAGGLFAYAATVTRFIGDRTHGGPAAQLRRVLEVIHTSAKDAVAGRNHPMDRLDALYRRILSNIPENVMMNTRKLLILHSYNRFTRLGFRTQCNALGLTEDDAYDAICHLHAVMKIPEPNEADDDLSYYHKSFNDFLHDFDRSGFSRDFDSEGYQLDNSTSLKIIEDLHDDGVAKGGDICVDSTGLTKGYCDNIPLSWPGDERFQKTDEDIRITLYREALSQARIVFSSYGDLQKRTSYFHVLTTRFTKPANDFPFYGMRACAFGCFRDELAKLGKLKQAPLRLFDYAAVCGNVELRFTSPAESNLTIPDPWNPSCKHRRASVDGLEQQQEWSTSFKRYHQVGSGADDDGNTDFPRFYVSAHQEPHEPWFGIDTIYSSTATCFSCTRRFAHHFMDNQDLLATFFVDGTQMCHVEMSFVDPNDGVSEWRYLFMHSGPPKSIDT